MKLIPYWRKAHRLATVQLAVLFTAWGSLPVDTQSAVLESIGVPANRLPAIMGLLLLAARLIDQPKTKE